MDRMRTRKPTFKSQPSTAPKATREEFKPAVDWTEDSSNRLLHMQLPGFKREDIRVQLDNAGKLLIKGSRQAPDNKYLDVDQSFDVPKDTITEKISGRFEDERLTLIMPKKVVEEQETTRKAEGKEKEVIQEEKPYTAEGKKEEEAFEDKKAEPFEEKPTSTEENKDGPIREEKKEAKTGEEKKFETMKEKTWSHEEKKDEPMHEEKPTTTEEKQDELSPKEKPKSEGEKKDDGPVLQEKPESAEEKKDDAPTCKENIEGGEKEKKSEKVEEKKKKKKSEKVEEIKKEDSALTETTKSSAMEKEKEEEPILLMKSKIKEICAGKTKDIRKRISAWKGAEDSWLDSGSFDGILEKLNRNRKVIAVAVVAFSVGFFVSQKLRTKGK